MIAETYSIIIPYHSHRAKKVAAAMANTPPPEPATEAPAKFNIPPEIIEEILSKLPQKSLLRFSCVSPSWNSIITSPHFAAKRGRETAVINDNSFYFDVRDAFYSSLSTLSNGSAAAASSQLFCPFRPGVNVKLRAFCDQLWCVAAKKSLYLWNPSTGACKKLEDSPNLDRALRDRLLWYKPPPEGTEVVYGLGYDGVDDDYKLLMVFRRAQGRWGVGEDGICMLYSLKSDSWSEIRRRLEARHFPDCNGLCVNGALHWMAISKEYNPMQRTCTLVCFDFSSEEFRVLEQPEYSPELNLENDVIDVAVLRGKLCVFLNYRRSFRDTAFVLWAMEDYGVEESWTKLYEIRYKSIPPIVSEFKRGIWFTLRPLYVYEDGRVVIWASSGYKESEIIVYKDRRVVSHSKIVARSGSKADDRCRTRSLVRGGFMFMQSLVSPNKWERLGDVEEGSEFDDEDEHGERIKFLI